MKIAGRLAQVMAANDLKELVALHESESATDDVLPRTSEAAPQAHRIERGTSGSHSEEGPA
ncbi:hypothetical protein [Streptomyces sp. 13-12-16]|uniref:hypothetical protein n=1 Tax=Streptomyces sp. 13-12-16 TaxID=1570823 RepID=UPI00118149A6|nr:hypothetical protein [Streptomyces sp. 13-12-16]